MLAVHTLGAGGGTIAWIGPDGLLKVGPKSAGAAPGPACYGRGGTQATVTDAHVVLGRLPTTLLAGEMRLAVLIEGSPGEAPLLREVAAALAEVTAPAETARAAGSRGGERPPIVVCQDPLDVFAALLERARVLIGNDSGPLHLAAALGVPSLYFAAREKLAHSHPERTASWALFDELANDPRRISVAQALGALREMRRQGIVEAVRPEIC